VTVQNHALKPRHDVGKRRTWAVPALIVRVPDRDEPGDPFVRRGAGQEKLIKVGAKVVSHGRYVAFQMAAAAIPRLIVEPRPQPAVASAGSFRSS
jgi:hypothetical protein